MAEGIPFDEANLILRAPTPEDAAAATVYDLHVMRYRDLDGRQNVLSKWKLSPEELEEVNRTGGVIWFNCWGGSHPPIWITGQRPFREPVPSEARQGRPAAADSSAKPSEADASRPAPEGENEQ